MTDSELMQLSEKIGRALKARGATVTTAESCTGGWIAKAITDIAGSSAWFERGFVTYSNEAKSQMIGVSEATLRDNVVAQRRFADADHLRFSFVAVGDKAAFKPRRAAGNIGDRFRNPAAGTGFRRGHRRPTRLQRPANLLA